MTRLLTTTILAATLAACATTGNDEAKAPPTFFDRNPYASTYVAYPSTPTLITNATIFDGAGGRIDNGAVLLESGIVSAVGAAGSVGAPEGARVIDGTGMYVTPGIIDVHSHLGNYPSPATQSHSDGNEATDPNTAYVWTEHSVWPQDPGFSRALANGGVTALQILPGSANLFGGRSVTLKNVPGRSVMDMKFPGAPYGLKMACGENPKRVYSNSGPATRMGNVAQTRAAWIEAREYDAEWDEYEENGGDEPARDLTMDTLRGVLDGDIRIHNHCYRADEMAIMLQMSEEFGYEVASFQHAVEAYKIGDLLRDQGTCAAMWADWYGFKMESYDGILENIAYVHAAGACAIVHSDDPDGIQRLNQEAAKAMAAGRRQGIQISEAEAWQWLSANPAKSIGVYDMVGSLEPGKMADVVLWNGNPYSIYTRPAKVWIDGALMFDVDDPSRRPVSDFELGQPGEGDVK